MTNLNDLTQNKSILIKGKLIDLNQPKIMGILNVTPDSFYDQSRSLNTIDLVNRAGKMIESGADIIDIGGISTRPGASKIDYTEEIKRIEFPVKTLRKEFPDVVISLDTYHAQTATIGLENGVDIINDVSGGQIDEEILDVVANYKVPYVLTHSYGMADDKPHEDEKVNILQELITYFSKKINMLHNKGIHDVIIDPGFGFGKTIDQNFKIISNLESLKILEKPILVGVSRKSMIYKRLNTSPENSLIGTVALNSLLVEKGAAIFRVHDVPEMDQIRNLIRKNLD
jgi:dihydropteroate synthase